MTEREVGCIVTKDVMYTLRDAENLLSVSKMVSKGLTVTFSLRESYISDTK